MFIYFDHVWYLLNSCLDLTESTFGTNLLTYDFEPCLLLTANMFGSMLKDTDFQIQLRYAAMALINACLPLTVFEGKEGRGKNDEPQLRKRCKYLADGVRH